VHQRILDPLGMTDTGFFVPKDKAHRLAACYAADGKGGFTLYDDPANSGYLAPPAFVSGGGGLLSTAKDYLTFCRALLNGGELDGVRLIGPKTLKLMTTNHLPGGRDLTELSKSMFSEATNAGIGFGLGFAVTMNPALALLPGSPGEFYWGGAASTAFWIDPAEELIAIFMTQLIPSSSYPVRRELRTIIYGAVTESNL
jgi:CubicO group peptidase (beta-lactamase class C family)